MIVLIEWRNIMPILLCKKCGAERDLTEKSYYESKRLKKELCRSCALKNRAPRGSKYDNLISKDDIFGKMAVLSEKVSIDGAWVLCECECGNQSKVRVRRLLDGLNRACKTCSIGIYSTNWRGVGELPSTVFTKIKLRAKNRNIKFDLTKKYLWKLYFNQNKQCALSGLDIDFGVEDGRNLSKYQGTASLDRIDSMGEYVEGNVQWVHKHINFMKLDHDEEYFKHLCKLVVENG